MINIDFDLLSKIYKYGGYTTTESVKLIRPGLSYSQIWQALNNLLRAGYLLKGWETGFTYSDSRRDLVIYKVSPKACNFFDNPGTYLKRGNNDVYIIKSLLKQHFFCEIDYKNYCVLAEKTDKLQVLNEVGFDSKVLSMRMLEYMIDARKTDDTLTCKASGEQIKLCSNITVIFIDNSYSSPGAQISTFINNYAKVLEMGLISFNFIVVVDSIDRENQYKRVIRKFLLPGVKLNEKAHLIHENIIRFHLQTLKKFDARNGTIELENYKFCSQFEDSIRQKYSKNVRLTDNFLMVDEVKNLIKNVGRDGLKEVEMLVNLIVNLSETREKRLQKVEGLFDKIYLLTSAGIVFNRNRNGGFCHDFDMKVYRISRKFY